MKKYIVAKSYDTIAPTCVFMTDILDDAKVYANIMERANKGEKYIVLAYLEDEMEHSLKQE